ncbi:MAG: hypothetical protein LBS62_14635 [Clostridiales bacterium]|nr:hypothetical protein [Clostridiales bacterium]
MATSSIFKNIVLKDKEEIEKFISALEKSQNKKNEEQFKSYQELKKEDLKEFFGE